VLGGCGGAVAASSAHDGGAHDAASTVDASLAFDAIEEPKAYACTLVDASPSVDASQTCEQWLLGPIVPSFAASGLTFFDQERRCLPVDDILVGNACGISLDSCACDAGGACATACWGGGAVCTFYDPPSGVIREVTLRAGYLGMMSAVSPVGDALGCSDGDSEHTYTLQIGSLIQRDSMVMPINFAGSTSAAVDELFDAINDSFGEPGRPSPGCVPGGCTGAGVCDYMPEVGSGYGSFTVPALGVTIRMQDDPSTGGAKVVGIDMAFDCPAARDE
jgi:hypothetical protein